jgi:hypothetical protein
MPPGSRKIALPLPKRRRVILHLPGYPSGIALGINREYGKDVVASRLNSMPSDLNGDLILVSIGALLAARQRSLRAKCPD